MTAALRDYREEDFPEVEGLWKRTDLYRWYNDPAKDIARFRRDGNARVIIAEEDGKVVGTACVGHDGHRGWVYYLAVEPKRSSGGLGRLLMEACENWLKDHDIPKMLVMVRATNEPVISFYKKIGYAPDPVSVWQKWLIDRGPAPEGEFDGTLAVTITYLEMHEAPSRPTPPKPSNITAALMLAEKPTVPFYRYLYAAVGDDWIWYERRKLSDQALAEIISHEKNELYVLYVDGAPGGYFEIDRRDDRFVEISFFGLMPHCIGLGLGGWLLHTAIETAWRSDPEWVQVNTCTLDHPRALGVYQKVGFSPVRQEVEIIEDPRLSGLVPYTERQVV